MSDEETDDDWFERALRDLEGDPTDTEDGSDAPDSDPTERDASVTREPSGRATPGPATSEDADGTSRGEETDDGGAPAATDEPGSEPGADPFGGVRGDEDVDSEHADPAISGDGNVDDGDIDEDGFSGGYIDEDGFSGGGFDDGDEVTGGNADFGGAGFDGEGAFDGESGDEFGFADFAESDGASGFQADDEAFESDIERVKIGIDGLDEMILGGVPARSLMSVIGSAGTGKTTLGLQFLHEALRSGEKAIYITLEESREAILATAEEKGWPFREYAAEGLLAVVALDPIEMANSLASIRNDLSRLISEFGAERLVLDSVSLLEMMYDHPAKRRSEVFDFTRSLKEAGVTTMLTSEADEENAYASRYGMVEYLTDAVFVLQYVRPSDFRETRLAVEIQKIRDANHSRETKPYEITNEGISVYRQANIF